MPPHTMSNAAMLAVTSVSSRSASRKMPRQTSRQNAIRAARPIVSFTVQRLGLGDSVSFGDGIDLFPGFFEESLHGRLVLFGGLGRRILELRERRKDDVVFFLGDQGLEPSRQKRELHPVLADVALQERLSVCVHAHALPESLLPLVAFSEHAL